MDQLTDNQSTLHYDYDSQYHDDNDNQLLKTNIVGTEMYNPIRFVKDFHVWRFPHLTSRFVHINEKFQLPGNSVLHTLDNIIHPNELLDTPRILTNPLIQNESYRKWIYHVTKPDLINDEDNTCPINIDWSSGEVIDTPTINKYIFRPAGMVSNFMKFRSEQKSNFRYLSSLTEIPLKREALTIINHNPLFRMQLFGRLQFFRRMQLIWASIINTCCKIPASKSQYIHIPLTNVVYPKEMFYRSRDKLNLVSVKQPNNYHYLFMMNYLNFINEDASTSMFSRIPEEVQKKLTFILVNGDTAIFHTLADIKTINTGNKAYLRIVNQLNMLSLRSSTDIQNRVSQVVEESSSPDSDDDYEEHVQQVDEVLAEKKTVEVSNTQVDESTKQTEIKPEEPKPIIAGFKDSSKRISLFDKKKDIAIDDTDDYADFSEDELSEIDKLLSDDVLADVLAPSLDLPPDPDAKQVENTIRNLQEKQNKFDRTKELEKSATTKNIIVRTESNLLMNKVLTTDINTSVDKLSNLNIPAVQLAIAEDTESSKRRAAAYVGELDAQAEALIDNVDATVMTPKAKERMKILAKKYKTLRIGNETLESILLKEVSSDVRIKSLDFLNDQIPDKSMLKSSMTNFDEEYLHSTFQRDLVSSITAFNKNGLFLIDVQEKKIVNELNHMVEYTLQFEDISNKVSSIKFTIPHVDVNGHCYVNGVRKTMKKQMINLPICKISPVRVSLSSNFNKTIVEKNVTKAHSFNEYFNSLLLKIRKSNDSKLVNISIDYGSHSTKSPVVLGYEYSSLMKKYNTFMVDTPIACLWCNFNYSNRFIGGDLGTELNPTPELLHKVQQAENTFGTYVGTIKISKKYSYMFIDINNIISVVDIQSGSVKYTTTFLELIISKVPNIPSVVPLTEWTDLKIADGKIPTIFVLAYRFGLFSILDYIGVKYTIVNRKDKKVIHNFRNDISTQDTIDITVGDDNDNVLNDVLAPITGTEHFDIDRMITYETTDAVPSVEQLNITNFGNDDGSHCYHLSPWDLGNTRIFKPRTFDIDEAIEVRQPPRICASPTIDGCIMAIGYNNVIGEKRDENGVQYKKHGYRDFYVYATEKSRGTYVPNEKIVNKKLVFDAHMTGEVWFTSPTKFEKVGKIRIYNKNPKTFDYKPLRGSEYFLTQIKPKPESMTAEDVTLRMYKYKWEQIADTESSLTTGNEALDVVEKYQYKPGDISIKFADVILVFNRYPITQSLIVSGLQAFDTEFIESSAMETKSAYFTLLELKGMSTNYLKGIDSFFDLFIDPITRDTLEQMNEPTNVRDLLIRATVLLSTSDHKEASSTANHKFRGYERFNAIVYNEMSRELANYRNRNSAGLKYSINPQAILQRIIQDEAMMPVQEINPIHDIKERTGFTYTGVGGRTSQSFVLEDRKYPSDGVGIISEATVDSAKVSINAVASMDPSIINTRGLVTQLPVSELEPTQVLSVSSLLLPGATNDDGWYITPPVQLSSNR